MIEPVRDTIYRQQFQVARLVNVAKEKIPCRADLLPSSDGIDNWPLVSVFTPDHVEHHAVNNSSSKNNTGPIHSDWGNDFGIGPEAEEHGDHRVNESDEIDDWAENWSHLPRSPMYLVFDWISSEAFLKD